MSLISVNNLTFGYDGSYNNIFEDVSFNIDTDWKLGLIGRNGKGKTTFLKLLQGILEYRGTISKNVDVDYFPFEVKDKEKLAIDIANEIAPNAEDWQFIKELNLLNSDAEILYRKFSLLSGGEQVKVLLISLFLKEKNFLLIDEPTNHLDVETKNNLIQYLSRKKGFIVVSHDRNFLDKVVDHIISINNTNIDIQKGNFSSWWCNKQNQDSFEQAQNKKLKKDIARLEESVAQTQRWSDKIESTKNGTRIAGLRPDKGAIGHKAAKMAKRSKAIELRRTKAIEEKTKLLQNVDKREEIFLTAQENKGVVLEVKNLAGFYGEKKIFDGVSFCVENRARRKVYRYNIQKRAIETILCQPKLRLAARYSYRLCKRKRHKPNKVFYNAYKTRV